MGPPFVGQDSAVFLSLNRNKKSLALDIRTAEGQAIIRRLVAGADALIADLTPDEAEELGLDYAALQDLNPQLVYCAVSAFGDKGPLRNLPGAELVIQAMADYTNSLGPDWRAAGALGHRRGQSQHRRVCLSGGYGRACSTACARGRASACRSACWAPCCTCGALCGRR